MKEITLPAEIDQIVVATEFVDGELEKCQCPAKTLMQMNIVIDEIFSNIIRYAYSGTDGYATIGIECSPDRIILVFKDSGTPYNPLLHDDPDTSQSASERGIGGLGIFMVKKMTSSMVYEYMDGFNVLTVSKCL